MKLAEYNSKEHIYIDANIFIYVILDNPERVDQCDEFLKRVEVGAISGVISPLIVDEVTFKIIIEEIKVALSIKSNVEVIKRIKRDPRLITIAEPELLTFSFVLENYKGLRVVSVPSSAAFAIFEVIKMGFLPRDALHIAIMRTYGIKAIATNDPDFERAEGIKVWKP